MSEQIKLTFDAAVAFLPEGDRIHTYLDGGVALLGADWDRADLLGAMRAAPEIHATGESAQSMRHGLAIQHPIPSGWLFIETTRRTDEAALPLTESA